MGFAFTHPGYLWKPKTYASCQGYLQTDWAAMYFNYTSKRCYYTKKKNPFTFSNWYDAANCTIYQVLRRCNGKHVFMYLVCFYETFHRLCAKVHIRLHSHTHTQTHTHTYIHTRTYIYIHTPRTYTHGHIHTTHTCTHTHMHAWQRAHTPTKTGQPSCRPMFSQRFLTNRNNVHGGILCSNNVHNGK